MAWMQNEYGLFRSVDFSECSIDIRQWLNDFDDDDDDDDDGDDKMMMGMVMMMMAMMMMMMMMMRCVPVPYNSVLCKYQVIGGRCMSCGCWQRRRQFSPASSQHSSALLPVAHRLLLSRTCTLRCSWSRLMKSLLIALEWAEHRRVRSRSASSMET